LAWTSYLEQVLEAIQQEATGSGTPVLRLVLECSPAQASRRTRAAQGEAVGPRTACTLQAYRYEASYQ